MPSPMAPPWALNLRWNAPDVETPPPRRRLAGNWKCRPAQLEAQALYGYPNLFRAMW